MTPSSAIDSLPPRSSSAPPTNAYTYAPSHKSIQTRTISTPPLLTAARTLGVEHAAHLPRCTCKSIDPHYTHVAPSIFHYKILADLLPTCTCLCLAAASCSLSGYCLTPVSQNFVAKQSMIPVPPPHMPLVLVVLIVYPAPPHEHEPHPIT